MKFALSATKQEANDTFSFIFAPEQPLQWKAGQLVRYLLDHPNPDDRGVERFFSIASAPHEKHVMLTTRFAPKSSSFKKALKNLRPAMQSKLTIWRAISSWMTPRSHLSSSLEESALHLFAPFCSTWITTRNR
jgi:ferredoxin-NADP reductase